MKPPTIDESWRSRITTPEHRHDLRKKRFEKQSSYGEPYNMAELRRALDDDREERVAKRKAAEEAKRKQDEEQEQFRLTPLPLALKAKAHAAKPAEEPVYDTSIEVQVCHCRSFLYPHFLEAHQELTAQYDWRTPEERERDEAKEREERERKRSLRAGEPGRRQPADSVRTAADRGPGKTGGQAG